MSNHSSRNEQCKNLEIFSEYPDVVTVDELMPMLKIGRNTAYRLVNDGSIHSFKMGRIHRIAKVNIIEYILKNNLK